MFVWSSFVAVDVFLESFIIVSTHRQCYVASETGFKQDSPNPGLYLLIGCTFLLNTDLDSICIRIQIL